MSKPIIYLQENLNTKHMEEIQQLAPDYRIIAGSKNTPEFNIDDIHILLGWNKSLVDNLLASPTSQLKWIQATSAGIDYFDLEAINKKKILLSNASGIHSISITEHVLGILLAEFRGIRTSILNQIKKEWHQLDTPYTQLLGKKMLIVGTGKIGQQLGKSATGLGIQVYGINTSGHANEGFIKCYSQKNMLKIIPDMDIIVNILPLTNQTYQLFDYQTFSAFKPQSVFINVGRGASVKTDDLIQALEEELISFAALDVFEEEPLASDSPLWEMSNVLITPHLSGLTPHFRAKLTAIFTENLKSFVADGRLLINNIPLNKGY